MARRARIESTGRSLIDSGRSIIPGEGSGGGDGPQGASSPNDWTIVMEDDFDNGNLDSDIWGIGFGFGTSSDNDDADVSADRVSVSDSMLRLEVQSEGDGSSVTQGAVNTKDADGSWNPDGSGVTYEPPCWIEARESPITRPGVLPAFWGKPNNEDWPPELDVMENFNYGDYGDDEDAHFNVHYSSSGACGDESTHEYYPSTWNSGHDLGSQFHVYGAYWGTDAIEFYVDGNLITTETDSTMLDTMSNSNCNPFYLMFTNHVNRVGTADLNSAWTDEHQVDWCRVWTQ